MSPKFSPFVTKALVDTITGGGDNDAGPSIGIYRSGPKIEQFFLDCGLDMRWLRRRSAILLKASNLFTQLAECSSNFEQTKAFSRRLRLGS
jgi:hypothetical protein